MSEMTFTAVLTLYFILSAGRIEGQNQISNVKYRPGQCLTGDKHRELPCPQPEGPDYRACFQWSNNTCCTAEFTTQLENATVRNVDGFHWSRCPTPLSERCQDYFKRIECFYRCSPNVAHWALEPYPSAFTGLPVCGDFCDNWFDACASDFTCARNWLTDWVEINGINHCVNDTCQTFSEIYGNGTNLCNVLWGNSFIYTNTSPMDPNRQCLSIWWPANETNPNDIPVRNIFGSAVDTVTPPACNGSAMDTVTPNGVGRSAISLSATILVMVTTVCLFL